MKEANPIETGLRLAPGQPPGRDRASRLLDAYQRAIHLRHDLTDAGEADREIAIAVAALDAVALALAGAALTALDRDITQRVGQAADEADRC